MQKWIILIIIFLIIILGIFIVSNVSIETEYTPEEEFEEVDLRKTIVTLYFQDKSSGELAKETRFVDSKELLKNPYEELVKLLMSGPENENYERIIPENVGLIEAKLESETVIVNFNKELEELNLDDIQKTKIYYSYSEKMENQDTTLTELTEVSNVSILSEGKVFFENPNNSQNL